MKEDRRSVGWLVYKPMGIKVTAWPSHNISRHLRHKSFSPKRAKVGHATLLQSSLVNELEKYIIEIDF